MNRDYNLCSQFLSFARQEPQKIALVEPITFDDSQIFEERIHTFEEFHQSVANFRAGFMQAGFKKGDRIIILCPVNCDFYAFMLAMLSLGLVAVFLDPGIGVKKLLRAIYDSKSKAIISVPRFLKYWFLIPQLWLMKRYNVAEESDKKPFGVHSLSSLYKANSDMNFNATPLAPKDQVLITYTSGSTGQAKGANRNAENVYEQLKVIKSNWVCHSSVVDLPIFLMFGFMNLLCGITTVLPAANYREIGNISPKLIVTQIKKWKVTRMSGSYTFHHKLAKYLEEQNQTINSVSDIALGGTPVNSIFCERMGKAYPNAKCLMTYGSTEVAPISFCPLENIVNVRGSFVGIPCRELNVKIVNLAPNYQGDVDCYSLPPGEIGEVIIQGPHVVKEYVHDPIANLASKVKDTQSKTWHRTGDSGYFDPQGNLILVGRLSDTIYIDDKKVYPLLIEGQVDEIPNIKRSALIQNKKGVFLCYDSDKKVNELLITKILSHNDLSDVSILNIPKIPLDDRHNSKINRIQLKGMV